MAQVSIIIPAYNEAGAIGETVRAVQQAFSASAHDAEIIVVNDGSRDETGRLAEEAGARVIRHPVNIGYGNALKTGLAHASHSIVAMTDADGTYPVAELPAMVSELDEQGLDMIVGARRGRHYAGNPVKRVARWAFRFLAEFATGQRIPDVNSGFRVVRRELIQKVAMLAGGGFSFSTTLTVIALLTSHFVRFREIAYFARIEKSKVRHLRDALRASQILVRAILMFNPIKLYIVYAGVIAIAGLCFAIASLALPRLSGFIFVLGAFALVILALLGLGLLAEQLAVYFMVGSGSLPQATLRSRRE